MGLRQRFLSLSYLIGIGAGAAAQSPLSVNYTQYPSEIPEKFAPPTAHFDHETRDVMIAMRDGAKLHTVILIPKGVRGAPILLTRTPYSAQALSTNANSAHLDARLWGYDNVTETIVEGGYIRVLQDVRGKYGSEGDFVMNRPMRGALNPTPVDESTDAFDTIEWLVKNIPETNGKVGLIGISYDGFLALAPLIDPHPALKVSVPMNPMVDGWRDDWFHNGAFRQQSMPYIYEQTATRDNSARWETTHYDDFDTYMNAGSAGTLGTRRGMDQLGFWKKITAHPSYDEFWKIQAMNTLLARKPLAVPTMIVTSLWDQEDIFGGMAVYQALRGSNSKTLFLVIGPWHHGQEINEAANLGAIPFDSDTGLYFRREILAPFLAHYLKDDAPPLATSPVTAYVTGLNRWQHLLSWPSGCEADCAPKPHRLFLRADGALKFEAPTVDVGFDEYISDPAKPVPYRMRPIQPVGYAPPLTWARWLVDDQREFSGRTDVMTYSSAALEKPIQVSGEPQVNLMASTSGADSDWVVKLIDVFPDEVAGHADLGGYQLAVAMEIFRGRYREDRSQAKPLVPNKPLLYRFALPATNHVFLPGHRLMVQVQSSWFPLYDRNPQTFVENIFFAQPNDYRKASQRIYRTRSRPSFVELPVIE